ncbi:MAG: SufD family Fe-S cluster assembly protein, partial [Muribaculaceae bacterium]|nr:SufD family Fe-S cluster assembly protein [Muribaculaceae bacterium]
IRHKADHTLSNQVFKYVADGQSNCTFDGLIIVDESARFTEAYQTNHNLLASNDAKMHTEPTLEIYCDEVKCSHGATTGQLDDTALFYMRSRGIPEAEARRMLMEAFLSDVIANVGIDSLRERLRHLVERRFSALAEGSDSCADCSAINALKQE